MTFTSTPLSTLDVAGNDASVPLTTAQRLLWLGQKLSPDSPLYNMAFLFELGGEIDERHFQAAFETLVQRCDALQLGVHELEGVPFQRKLVDLDCTVLF